MQNLITVLAILAIMLFAAAVIKRYMKKLTSGCCGAGGDKDSTKKLKVADRDKSHYPYVAELVVDGMVCGNCARRIENALNAQEGVWAVADVSAGTVTVRMKQPVSEQMLRDTVNRIGAYTVMAVRQPVMQ